MRSRKGKSRKSFNPRPREGGDFRLLCTICRHRVSIHAPAKGATISAMNCSIVIACFNPRPREGGDPFCDRLSAVLTVSIHAPAKGATIVSKLYRQHSLLFQSTPPRRGRRRSIATGYRACMFQSTPPRRGRLICLCNRFGCSCFNPRPREGGDLHIAPTFQCTMVSIHAPAKGATMLNHVNHQQCDVSIHAPAKGATVIYIIQCR